MKEEREAKRTGQAAADSGDAKEDSTKKARDQRSSKEDAATLQETAGSTAGDIDELLDILANEALVVTQSLN